MGALIVLGGLLPACADGSQPSSVAVTPSEPPRSEGGDDEFPYTGQQVFDLFFMHGLYLARGEHWDRIALNSVATPQQRDAVTARYGTFFVSIAHDDDAIRTLLSDPVTQLPLRSDARGIYWYQDPGIPGVPAAWFALTRHSNVVAAWMAGGEQRTDEHWDRMTAELERLPPP